MNGITPRVETRANFHNLTGLEEEFIDQYIPYIDSRGFPPSTKSVEDMANYFLGSGGAKKVVKVPGSSICKVSHRTKDAFWSCL